MSASDALAEAPASAAEEPAEEEAPRPPRRRRSLRRRLRNAWRDRSRALFRSPRIQAFVGGALARYLRFVRRTSSLTCEPADPYAAVHDRMPVIITMWHGQHFMLPFARREGHEVRVLISRHGDGGINAAAAERLGLGTIRGSGGRLRHHGVEKGGIRGFLEMKSALAEGVSVCMTADISNGVARRAGMGIVRLARASGRPIAPAAFVTSRRIVVRKSWDQAAINLPFSRAALVVGEPILVPADADDAAMEACRQRVEDELNRVTGRAYAIADRRG